MKTIGILLAFAILALNAIAGQCVRFKNPKTIYKNTESTLVTGVELTDSATIITMLYKNDSQDDTWIKIPSGTCLSDENATMHKLKDAIGIGVDSITWIPKHGELEFSLIFGPLPKGTNVFDYIEGNPSEDAFRIIGIHDDKAGYDLSKFKQKTANQANAPECVYSRDTTYIYGKINGYSPDWGCDSIYSFYRGLLNDINNDKDVGYVGVAIEGDGSFILKLDFDVPSWSYFRAGKWKGKEINFFAFPGDKLYIDIDDFQSENRKVSYRSEKGNSTYESLMKAATYLPVIYYNPWKHAKLSDGEFMSIAKKFREEQITTINYLIAKFALSSFESRMLWNRAALNYGSALFFHASTLEDPRKEHGTGAAGKGNCKFYPTNYTFLKDMPLDDDYTIFDQTIFTFFMERLSASFMTFNTLHEYNEDKTWLQRLERLPSLRFGHENNGKVLFTTQVLMLYNAQCANDATKAVFAKYITTPYLKELFNKIVK